MVGSRRGFMMAVAGLVAGSASSGSHEPQEPGQSPVMKKHKVREFNHPCPVCKENAVYISTRIAEVAPRGDVRAFEQTGLVYYHVGKLPCDLPMQEVVPITVET